MSKTHRSMKSRISNTMGRVAGWSILFIWLRCHGKLGAFRFPDRDRDAGQGDPDAETEFGVFGHLTMASEISNKFRRWFKFANMIWMSCFREAGRFSNRGWPLASARRGRRNATPRATLATLASRRGSCGSSARSSFLPQLEVLKGDVEHAGNCKAWCIGLRYRIDLVGFEVLAQEWSTQSHVVVFVVIFTIKENELT